MPGRISLLLLLSLLLSPRLGWAWPPTYGTEYNFSSRKLKGAWENRGLKTLFMGRNWQVPGKAERNAAADFAGEVKARCGADCTVTTHLGKFEANEFSVAFKNGYSFNVSVDPACVEIQTTPETLEQLKQHEPQAQKFIFGVAEKLGLTKLDGPAHLNIGFASAFGDDPKAFLKFFADYHNHEELASGVLGIDFSNAPPLSRLQPEQRQAFAGIVDDVNAGKEKSARAVAKRIQEEVYTSTPYFKDGPEHYQGIGLKYVNGSTDGDDKPFELRATRQPQNAHERTLLAELMEKRIAYEKENPGPIVFLDRPKKTNSNARLANRFRIYLLDMQADWDTFQELLPPDLRKQPPDAFVKGTIRWNRIGDIKLLREYAPFVGSSPWVRARMLELMQSPEAQKSPYYPQVVDAIKTAARENSSRSLDGQLQEFLAQIRAPEPPQGLLPTCSAYFRRLLLY